MVDSIFEQFGYHSVACEVEAILWWFTALISTLCVYHVDEMISFGEYLSWINLVTKYNATQEIHVGVIPFYLIGLCSCFVSIIDVFFGESLMEKIAVHCVFIIGYLMSNWVSSVLLVGVIIFFILMVLPVSIVGHRRFLVSACDKVFVSLYTFFYELVSSYLKKDTKYFFPFIFYIFLFISLLNLCGMMPYSLALTSHLIVTCSIAVISWGGFLLCGIERHGTKLFSIFYPNGLSFYLVPFVCLIEVISHIIRVLSLALRLFSNIVAGHILVDLVSLFLFKLTASSFLVLKVVILLVGLVILLILFFFECAICVLQGYIFSVLVTIYCKDYVQVMH